MNAFKTIKRYLIALAVAFPLSAHAQSTLLQAGPTTDGHAPMYVGSGGGQAIVQDSGPAGGGGVGQGLSELLLTMRGMGNPPYSGTGTGPLGTNWCDYDAPITNPSGYHYLCFGPNATGDEGVLTFGAAGAATDIPFIININGVNYNLSTLASSAITVGTTSIGSGTNGYLLFDNVGILGNESPSSLTVTPTNANTARTLAKLFGDLLTVNDFGADPTGILNSNAAFASLAAALGSAGLGIVSPAAAGDSYKVTSSVALNDTAILGLGAPINNVDNFPGGNIDASEYNAAGMTFYRQLSAAGTSTPGSANEFGFSLFGYIPPTSSAANYEKALFSLAQSCNDPSTVSISRDCVAADFTTNILVGNTEGSATTLDAKLFVYGSGHGSSIEMDIYNESGVNAGVYGSSTSLVGDTVFAIGNANSTAGISVDAAGAQFIDGVLVTIGAATTHAYALRNPNGSYPFYVDPSGNVLGENFAILGLASITPIAISALPTCNSGEEGTIAFVKDSTASATATFHGSVAGSGSSSVNSLVSCNGSNWQYD